MIIIGITAIPGLRSTPQFRRAVFLIINLPAVLQLRQTTLHFLELRSVNLVTGPSGQELLDLVLRLLDAVRRRWVRLKRLRQSTRLLLLLSLNLFEKCRKRLRIVPALVHVFHAKIIGLGLEPAAELQHGGGQRQARSLLHSQPAQPSRCEDEGN